MYTKPIEDRLIRCTKDGDLCIADVSFILSCIRHTWVTTRQDFNPYRERYIRRNSDINIETLDKLA